jgi:ankyrin repeat protein
MLIEAGADVNMANDLDETPLHIIASRKNGNVEVVRLLVESGADLNAKRIFDETPLLVAEYAGATAIVEELVKLGAR